MIRLADALIRLQRVNSDGRAVITAENRLRAFLRHIRHYGAQPPLAAVLLSHIGFGEAIPEAELVASARSARRLESWRDR